MFSELRPEVKAARFAAQGGFQRVRHGAKTRGAAREAGMAAGVKNSECEFLRGEAETLRSRRLCEAEFEAIASGRRLECFALAKKSGAAEYG